MTEYYTVKHIDNSRLTRPVSPARLHDFWRRIAAGGTIATCLLFYAWQHFECIQLRYKVEQLESLRAQNSVLNEQLHLEVDTLRAPDRVDAIARKQLGLVVAVPGQMSSADGSSDGVLAQARVVMQPRP
jgi:cell division protein FtsL